MERSVRCFASIRATPEFGLLTFPPALPQLPSESSIINTGDAEFQKYGSSIAKNVRKWTDDKYLQFLSRTGRIPFDNKLGNLGCQPKLPHRHSATRLRERCCKFPPDTTVTSSIIAQVVTAYSPRLMREDVPASDRGRSGPVTRPATPVRAGAAGDH